MSRRILYVFSAVAVVALLLPGCIISNGDDDPCKGITCDGHGTCMEDAEGEPYCACDDNHHAEGLSCIFDGYTVSLEWAFGEDQKTCMNAQVGQVHVEVVEGGTVLVQDTLACSDGGVDIEEMDDGSYTVNLTAIDNDGYEAYRASLDFAVAGADEDLGVVTLDPFGLMAFQWSFDGLDCIEAGVSLVYITVYDIVTDEELFSGEPVDCSEGEAEITNWELGEYNLVLEGACESDPRTTGYVFDGTVEINQAGRNNFGVIPLEDNGGC